MSLARRKILLLTFYYPPSPAVGALRAQKVARAFQRAGHEVLVLTARLPGETEAVRHQEPGLTVRAIRSIPNPRFWYLGLKERIRGRPATRGASGSAQVSVAAPASVPGWKRLLGALLWLPDDKQGFIFSACAAAVRHGPFDLIYSTAPPFSVHLAALLFKPVSRAAWAAEFRDPWTDNPWKPPHVRTRPTEAAERWLERRVLKSADYVVAVSEGIHHAMMAKVAADKRGNCLLVRNGIERLRDVRPDREPGPFRIVHIGSFYHGRDPRDFLDALAALVAERRLGPDQLQLELVGNCRWFSGVSVEREVERLGLTSMVRFTDWVPHEEAQATIAGADLLLLLAQDQPLQVPNKLYEYLGTRIPILAYADEEGESAAILREAGGHYLVTSANPGAAAGFLAQALVRANQPRDIVNQPSLEEMTVEHQMQKLVAAVFPA